MAITFEKFSREKFPRQTVQEALEAAEPEAAAGKWLAGVGSFGVRQAHRTHQQAVSYGVGDSILLTTLLELDRRTRRRLERDPNLGTGLPILYPNRRELGNAGNQLFGEGFGRLSIEEVWELSPIWIPIVDSVLERSIQYFQHLETMPSSAVLYVSPGGHGIVGGYAAYFIALRMPYVRRSAITVVPEDESSREEFEELLQAFCKRTE